MNNINWHSAAALSKKSCSKMMFDASHKLKPVVTDRMIAGEAWQKAQTVSEYVEMSGQFIHKDIGINFSVDEIIPGKRDFFFVEHKMVTDHSLVEGWFFHSSLIQTAFYGALHRNSNGLLSTASFVDDPKHSLSVPWNKAKYRLNFGGDLYNVKFNDVAIMKFFLTKARCLGSWVKSKQFDLAYSKKEWPAYFKDHVFYSRVKPLKVANLERN